MHDIIDFLEAVGSAKDTEALARALNLVKLSEKKDPDRLVARPRSLLLIPQLIVGGGKKWRAVSASQRTRYEGQRDRFQDRWLEQRWDWTFGS